MDKTVFISIGILLALVILISAASIMPEHNDKNNDIKQYAVIFKPSYNFKQAFESVTTSGGTPISFGFFDFIVITASPDTDYVHKLYENGALLVFNPIIKGGCYKKDDTPLHVAS